MPRWVCTSTNDTCIFHARASGLEAELLDEEKKEGRARRFAVSLPIELLITPSFGVDEGQSDQTCRGQLALQLVSVDRSAPAKDPDPNCFAESPLSTAAERGVWRHQRT